MALAGIITFAVIRLRNSPERLGRQSRFKGSHLGGAWVVLFMIFNVIWSLFLFRGAASALGNLPYEVGAFMSIAVGNWLDGLDHGTVEFLEHLGLLLHIGIMLVFLIDVVHSKHLHIFVAPLNVMFGRQPQALGAVVADEGRTASRSPSTTSRTSTRTPGSASAPSRTSRGRACSTSRPAPSAAAASRSAPPGTPRSRSRPRC